jgi:hypothetical protein
VFRSFTQIFSLFLAISLLFSGLAVRPNPEDIFQQAEGATADDSKQIRRTITMVSEINKQRTCEDIYVFVKK